MHSLLPFSSYQWMDYVDTTNPWHVKEGPTLVGPYHVTFYMAVLHVQGASPPLKWPPFSWFLIHLAVALWLSISKKTSLCHHHKNTSFAKNCSQYISSGK